MSVSTPSLVRLDPSDSLVLGFNWDGNLSAGVAIATSTFTLTAIHPAPVTVTSITRVTTTATVTQPAHGYVTGDWVTIADADQADYNLTAPVTVLTADTYTYAVANNPTTPATGTITAAAGVGKDNPSILTASPSNSRVTQVRIIGGGNRYVGRIFELANQIVTNEGPTQTKERSIRILVEQQ